MFVQFHIPRGTVELGRVIDTCVARCVERWGGCYVTDGIGSWRQPNSVITDTEPIAILNVSYRDGIRIADAKTLRVWFDTLAVYVRDTANQHTVYYQIFLDSIGRFVGPGTITTSETPAEPYGAGTH